MSAPEPLDVGPTWYKCPNCDTCRNQRKEFLVHLESHNVKDGRQNENRQIFHTANGKILRITELPNTYTIFTPNIELRPLEDVCRKHELKLKQPNIKVPRLMEADFEAALLLEAKRQKLRAKPKRKYFASDIQEDDIFVPGEEDHEDSDDRNFHPHHKHKEPCLAKKRSKRFKKDMRKTSDSGPGRPCVPCGVNFDTTAEYTVHVTEAHYKDGAYFCSGCPLQTRKRYNFTKHQCAKEELIRCFICSPMTEWTYRSDYQKHVVTHRVNGKYACGRCPLTSRKPYYLNVHIERDHTDRPPNPRQEWLKMRKSMKAACTVCGKLVGKYLIKTHLEMHKRKDEANKSKPFHCAVCDEGFTTKVSLQRHFQFHVENNPYICQFPGCGKRSSSKYVHREHYELHYGTREFFSCDICNVRYSRRHRLVDHNKRFHSEPDSNGVCKGDPKPEFRRRKPVFKAKRIEELLEVNPSLSVPSLPNPIYDPAPVLSFACLREPAEDVPNQEGRLDIGSVHLGDETTIKDECREAMLSVNEELEACGMIKQEYPKLTAPLQGGLAMLPEEVPLGKDPVVKRLEVENPEFVKLLARGTAYTNYGDHDAFPCKICVYPKVSYPRLHHLVSHMKKHHPEEAAENSVELSASELMFTCGTCGFQSKTSQELSRHMKTHTTRKFHCPKCSSRFETQIRLDYHEQTIHLAERNHKCNTCGKGFTSLANLHQHKKKIHAPPPADPNDLICKQCGLVALNLTTLKAHVRLHSKTRVLSYCKICNEKLSSVPSLRRHIQLVHLKVKRAAKVKAEQVIPESELFL